MKPNTQPNADRKSDADAVRELLQGIALRALTIRQQAMSGLPAPCDDATAAALSSLSERLTVCDADLSWVYFRRQEPAGSARPIDHISSGFERLRIEHGDANALREVIDHLRDVSEVARDSELFRRLSGVLAEYAAELPDDPICDVCHRDPHERECPNPIAFAATCHEVPADGHCRVCGDDLNGRNQCGTCPRLRTNHQPPRVGGANTQSE